MNEPIQLNNSNYIHLQNEINRINSNYYISALNLMLWSNYGLKVFYYVEENAIYIFIVLNNEIEINGYKISGSYILRPVIKQSENSYNYLIESIKIFKIFFENKKEIYLDRLFEKDLFYFKNAKIISKSDSSYIYLTSNLYKFPGKKMQKKRNLYNFYLKNYDADTTYDLYSNKYKQEIIKFCEQHSLDNDGVIRDYEINSIKSLLMTNDPNLSGLLIYHNNELVGVTIGYTRNNVYEIFVEKATRHLKGCYQYLISSNIEHNNIKTKYIDRQDSERMPGLEKSKRSYKPEFIFYTYFVMVEIE